MLGAVVGVIVRVVADTRLAKAEPTSR